MKSISSQPDGPDRGRRKLSERRVRSLMNELRAQGSARSYPRELTGRDSVALERERPIAHSAREDGIEPESDFSIFPTPNACLPWVAIDDEGRRRAARNRTIHGPCSSGLHVLRRMATSSSPRRTLRLAPHSA